MAILAHKSEVDDALEELERQHRSGGTGLPPIDLPPTGGGGNNNNENWYEGDAPRALLKRIRLLLAFALFGDASVLIFLIFAFYYQQRSWVWDFRVNHIVRNWIPIAPPPLLYLNTAILLLALIPIEISRRRIFHEVDVMDEWLGLGKPVLKRTLPWLVSGLVIGFLFLVGQLEVWRQLHAQKLTFAGIFATPASTFFYILSGFHLLHLLFALAGAGVAAIFLPQMKNVEIRQVTVDILAWFWHWMTLMWLILFLVIYLSEKI